MAICALRIANNTRRKQGEEWVDHANYFDVKIFGRQGENAAQYLSKGRPVAIDGRLEWREFTDQQGNKRQGVEIIADNVQFLGGRDEGGGGSGGFTPRTDIPVDTADFAAAPAGGTNGHAGPADDDIPF
jgi:single-strand DNA-binding protein